MSSDIDKEHIFERVLESELGLLRPDLGEETFDRAHKADLAGLAFSGGGIRSATFNLGVMQGLSKSRTFAENAGVDGSIIVGKLMESKDKNLGYNAQTDKFVDMFKDGIVDPAKVVRAALQDAASVAGLLITTEAMVADKPEPAGAGGGMPGGMPDMGGMGGMGGMPGMM